MTATGFLTPEQPRLGVSYQLISLIPPNHQLMQDCNAYGEWSPTEDLVYVPQWLYEQIMRTYGGDHTHDDEPPTTQPEAPEIQGLRNIAEQTLRDQPPYEDMAAHEEAQRGFQDQIDRLRMRWAEGAEGAAPPAPQAPLVGQNIVPPAFEQEFNDALREPVFTDAEADAHEYELADVEPDEEDDEVVYSPTVRAITVVSTMRIRVSRQDVERMTESEMVEHVLSQYHNIQDELTQRLDPIMRWAHERWRHYHAVPNTEQEGTTLTTPRPTTQRDAGTQDFWRTEFHVNAGGTGVPANQGAVIRNVE